MPEPERPGRDHRGDPALPAGVALATAGDTPAIPHNDSAEELYERAPCGYVTAGPSGLLVRVNKTFLDWTGHSREELVGQRRLPELLTIGGQIFYETHFGPLLRMQGSVSEVQLELRAKDGRPVPVLINAVLERDLAGEPVLIRAALFNIAERKRFEQELQRARKRAETAAEAKSEFLSMMSHEIRTPLSAIVGIAGLLRRTPLSAKQARYVRILESSSDNLLFLLNNILDFAKLDSGQAGLEQRAFDVRHLAHAALYAFSVKGEEKQLVLQVEVAPDVPRYLTGDPVKIGQVLTNLVSNAIKFTDRGSVTVAVRALGPPGPRARLSFSVRDTGIGIPPERLKKVFEPFEQADYDVGLKYGGTGLGLAISAKILSLYHSKMEVESAPGVGTTFSFELELAVASHAEAPAGVVKSITASLERFRFLVAEDNAVNAFMIREFLEGWNTTPVMVPNGREVLEALQRERFDAVLMDLRMPEMDGVEATRQIRALPDEPLRSLPVIALTASDRLGLEERMEDAGFTAVVEKPFKAETLLARLMKHVPGVADAVSR